MKLRVLIFCVSLLILASCGTKKNVVKKKKDVEVVLVEPTPTNLPSTNEKEHIANLRKNGGYLNEKTLKYIEKYASTAVREMHLHKIPASITLAQGILESGNGSSELAAKSNNHFGIKCHSEWNGKRVYHDDDDDKECFRKYKFVESSYKDHSAFLTKRGRYSDLFTLGLTNYKKWAKGLRKAGYATDRRYPSKLINLIETYKLNKFDFVKNTAATVKTEEPTPTSITKTATVYYQVKKGDTLYSISRKFNISVEKLKELNNLNDTVISINQELKVQ